MRSKVHIASQATGPQLTFPVAPPASSISLLSLSCSSPSKLTVTQLQRLDLAQAVSLAENSFIPHESWWSLSWLHLSLCDHLCLLWLVLMNLAQPLAFPKQMFTLSHHLMITHWLCYPTPSFTEYSQQSQSRLLSHWIGRNSDDDLSKITELTDNWTETWILV